jgi:hypothetical protein
MIAVSMKKIPEILKVFLFRISFACKVETISLDFWKHVRRSKSMTFNVCSMMLYKFGAFVGFIGTSPTSKSGNLSRALLYGVSSRSNLECIR